MSKLHKLWHFLEQRHDRTAVLSEWQERLGEEFEVVKPMLVPLELPATSYPNPNPYGLPLRVVHHADGAIVAVCTEGFGTRLVLTHRQIVLWKLSLKKLRESICTALKLRSACGDIYDPSDILLLGKYRPKPAAEFSVHLIMSKRRSFSRIVKTLCRETEPFILLVTSLDECTDQDDDSLRKKKTVLMLLEDVLAPAGVGFKKTENWAEGLDRFARIVNPNGRPNFSNKPGKKGQKTAANTLKIRQFLKDHIHAEYDRIQSDNNARQDPKAAPKLTKKQIGAMVAIRPDEVTRAFKKDPLLESFLEISADNESILKFGRRLGR